MDVSNENFSTVFDKFVELLSTCAFYTLDEEMTGINIADKEENQLLCPSEAYAIKREAAIKYSMIQVGVCLFHESPEGGDGGGPSYVARPFNFIVFPSGEQLAQSSAVQLSPSAIGFLTKHNMNFDAWMYSGIPYCQRQVEDQIRVAHRENIATLHVPPCMRSTDTSTDGNAHPDAAAEIAEQSFANQDERRWITEALREVELFAMPEAQQQQQEISRAGKASGSVSTDASFLTLLTKIAQPDEEKLLPPCASATVRSLFKRYCETHYDNVLVGVRGRNNCVLVRVTKEKRVTLYNERLRKVSEALRDSLGFRLIAQALEESRKPLVGHNCFADLLFLVNACSHTPPEDYGTWKTDLNRMFPEIYDTKYICSLFPRGTFRRTHLGGLYSQFTDPHFCGSTPLVQLPLGFQRYDQSVLERQGRRQQQRHRRGSGGNAAHEAAYDAYMTGFIFANMLRCAAADDLFSASAAVNKIAIFRSCYASNVTGDDVALPTGPMLQVEHAKGMTSEDVSNYVKKYAPQEPMSVSGLTDESSLVELRESEKERAVVRNASSVFPANEFIKSVKPFVMPSAASLSSSTSRATPLQQQGQVSASIARLMEMAAKQAKHGLLKRGK